MTKWQVALGCTVLGLMLPASVYGQSNGASSSQPASGVSTAAYVPPMRGAPEARISGSTRGQADGAVLLDVIAPDHIGRTLQEQPTLYWFSSQPLVGGVEITLIADESGKTILDAAVPGPLPAGIHAFRLAGTAAHLVPHVVYQWSVTDVVSQSEPSRDVVTSGMIERVPASEIRVPAEATGTQAAATYAQAGIWYDAIDLLSRGIEQAPSNPALRSYRASLLAQVGLKDAAEFDRGALH